MKRAAIVIGGVIVAVILLMQWDGNKTPDTDKKFTTEPMPPTYGNGPAYGWQHYYDH
jgi:hypothetical protein